MTELENLYSVLGGRFITPASEMRDRLEKVRAFVFDWDGVFNDGSKTSAQGSTFSEVDSMGVNLLRFSYYLRTGQLPLTLVLSGERNETAFHYCRRECLTYSFFKIPHKAMALEFLCNDAGLQPSEIAYFFDDVLDIPIAEKAGLRIQVNQRVNPLFLKYCQQRRLTDYLTAAPGGGFAVREACELLMGLYDVYDEAVEGRKNSSPQYREYLDARRAVSPRFYTLSGDRIVSAPDPGK